MVKDVIDGLKLVADGIESVKKIADAVKSGREYVATKHPNIQTDLRLLLEELRKSVLLIKRASAVLTNFRFAISTDNQGLELARFNNYFIQSKTEAQHLQDHIDDLRTHCSKIREHGKQITGDATRAGFIKLFTMLGLNSPEKEKELGEKLDTLAYEDFQVANSAAEMLKCLVVALTDVQDALGEDGGMRPANMRAAAALLAEYGPAFEIMEEQAAEAVKELRESATGLE